MSRACTCPRDGTPYSATSQYCPPCASLAARAIDTPTRGHIISWMERTDEDPVVQPPRSLFPPAGIALVLPYPPSSNTLYPTGRDARRHLSAAGVGYHRQVGQAVLVQWPRAVERPLRGRVTVMVQVYPPDRRRRDLGNVEKATMDSLTKAGVWEDDVQIDELHLYRRAVVAVGYVEVRIQQMKGPEQCQRPSDCGA